MAGIGAAVAIALAMLPAGAASPAVSQRSPSADRMEGSAARSVEPSRKVARCKKAALGTPRADWRDRAANTGRFGLLAGDRRFKSPPVRSFKNGNFLAKLGAIVARRRPVVVRVPEAERERVGLDYGDFNTERRIEDAETTIKFKPYRSRKRTGWPGGLVLADLEPVTLEVTLRPGAKPRQLEVGCKRC